VFNCPGLFFAPYGNSHAFRHHLAQRHRRRGSPGPAAGAAAGPRLQWQEWKFKIVVMDGKTLDKVLASRLSSAPLESTLEIVAA
jgi:hypothetical protein